LHRLANDSKRPKMTWSMATLAKLMLAVTLVAATFFVAPIAEAATCASELVVAHAAADPHPSDDEPQDPETEHGICAHGHCHHNGSARTDSQDAVLAQHYGRPVHASLPHKVRASISPDGLKRPPRG